MLLASTPVLLAAAPPPAGGGAPAAPPAPPALTLPGSDLVVLAAVAAVAVACVVLGLVLRARVLAGDDRERGADALAATGPRALVVALVVVALAAALWSLPGGSVLPRGQVLTAGVELRAIRSGVLLGGAAVAALVVRLAAGLPGAAAARATAAVLADRTTGRESAVRLLSRAGGALGLVTVGLGLLSACAVLLVAGATDHVAAAPQALLALALGAAVVALVHVRAGAPAALLPVLVALLAAGPLLGGQAIGARGLVLPLLAPGIGALLSLVGVALVSVREDEGVQAAVDRGLVIPVVLTAGFSLVAAFAYLPATYGAPLALSADVQGMLALSPAVSNPRLAVGGAVLLGALLAAVALARTRRSRGRAAGPLAVLALAVLALALLSNGVVTLGLFLVALAGTSLVSCVGAVLTASAFGAVGRDASADVGGPERVRGVARALLGELAEVGATARARTAALAAVASVVAGVALVGALFAAASAAITVAAETITVQPGPLLVAAVVDYRSFSPLVLVGVLAGAATAAAVRDAGAGPGGRGTLAPALLALAVPVAVGIALGVTALLGLVVGTALVAALGALLGGAPTVDPVDPVDPSEPATKPALVARWLNRRYLEPVRGTS